MCLQHSCSIPITASVLHTFGSYMLCNLIHHLDGAIDNSVSRISSEELHTQLILP